MSIFSFRKQNLFPTLESDYQLYNGIPYKDLPICNIRVSHNNTIFTLTEPDGKVRIIRSCGMEGFKNTKKGTNIAAQTTGITIATVCKVEHSYFIIAINYINKNS